jgi:putative ABC transport system permease protein
MLRNYFKVAFRYLAKHKGYTVINILGLAVGIASCILVMIFVRSEWSFDRFHSKSDRIHRAWLQEFYQGEIFTNVVTPLPLGPVLQDNLAEVETTCRVYAFNALTKYNNTTFNDPVNMVDSSFFNIFDFPLKEGIYEIRFLLQIQSSSHRQLQKNILGTKGRLVKPFHYN